MGFKDEIEEHEELKLLASAIENAEMNEAQRGIARLVVAKQNTDGLTPAQMAVYEDVLSKFIYPTCVMDGDVIPTGEVEDSWENGGYCSSCANMLASDD